MKNIKRIVIFVLLAWSTVVFADAEIKDVPIIDQDIFEGVFNRNYICGPTVFAELMGYWGTHGYPNLLRGNLTGDVPDTGSGMQNLFDEALSYSGYTGSYTYPEPMVQGIKDYFSDNGYDVEVVLTNRGGASWAEATNEIDEGRPVLLLVWSLSHWVVFTGYEDYPRAMDILYGHIPYERTWMGYSLPRVSNVQAIYVRPAGNVPPPVDPSIEPWYEDVMEWCQENDWELEPND